MLIVHSWATAFGYFNLRYTFPSKNLLLVKDALVFTSREDDLSVSAKAHREETFGPSADTGKQDAAESSSLVYTSTPLKSSDHHAKKKKSQQNLGKF